jgi:hypothetical protein
MNGTSRLAYRKEVGKNANRDVPFIPVGWNKGKANQWSKGCKYDRAPKVWNQG